VKLIYFISAAFEESITTIIIGIAAFVMVLVLTLNLAAASLSLILVVSIAIFQKSFSRGWLFLFGIILLLPSTKIEGSSFNLHDIFLIILATIGLVNVVIFQTKIKFNNLSYPFFLLGLIGLSYSVFGIMFDFSITQDIIITTVLLVIYWVIMLTFQFFFQTQKRLYRFFVLIISIAVAHSIFGIIAFCLGFQTPGGLGISSGAIPYFAGHSSNHQINGFLGDGYILRIGENALAPLLLISIPLTMALFVNLKRERKNNKNVVDLRRQKRYHLLDSIYTPSQRSYFQQLAKRTKIQKVLQWLEIVNRSSFFIFLVLMIQAVALVLTFDYLSMVVLSFAVFVFGVLLRKKPIITLATISIVILTLIFPNIRNSLLLQSEANLQKWFDGFSQISNYWIWGSGWKFVQQNTVFEAHSKIYNSYLYIWNIFGIFGLVTFFGLLGQFFVDLRRAYLKSDGKPRIWLISILVIFFEMVILGISGNTLLFGPSAIVLWLLYAVAMNLEKKKIIFGLTETRLQE
jgi:hypothetical protein